MVWYLISLIPFIWILWFIEIQKYKLPKSGPLFTLESKGDTRGSFFIGDTSYIFKYSTFVDSGLYRTQSSNNEYSAAPKEDYCLVVKSTQKRLTNTTNLVITYNIKEILSDREYTYLKNYKCREVVFTDIQNIVYVWRYFLPRN